MINYRQQNYWFLRREINQRRFLTSFGMTGKGSELKKKNLKLDKKNLKIKKGIVFILVIQLLIFISTSAYAHKVSTYAYREGDKIFGECYFVDGSPCKNSKVEVYDLKGQKILEAVTDEKGKYSFTIKEKGTLRIVIPAGEGHRAEYKLEGIAEKTEKKDTKETIPAKTPNKPVQSEATVNKDEIKQIIDEVMDAKLQGLRAEIMDLRKQMDKVSLRDIIGGIGYIFGIWGIIMLLKRKKNAS
ncbi:hypothetical protein [Thermodesulfovibrio yellowstonii]|uniref:Nickel transport protein n=1 Tax=Thermodesulfovibrio yellowstonii TaxID=28262 RepID=A0A9W6GEZ7_9BACT|nr:hypothetical protein [Thermodesulfovibrio islandicus]GLI52724.1 hypothetical protein TISLANDTSLP1_04170 [Thermodesulfovibrio islandicus]